MMKVANERDPLVGGRFYCGRITALRRHRLRHPPRCYYTGRGERSKRTRKDVATRKKR